MDIGEGHSLVNIEGRVLFHSILFRLYGGSTILYWHVDQYNGKRKSPIDEKLGWRLKKVKLLADHNNRA